MVDQQHRSIRVGVDGASGRMGVAVCAAVEAAEGLELAVAGSRGTGAADYVAAGCDVVVDFTVADRSRELVPELLADGVHVVVGTSAITADDLEAFAAASASGGANVVVAANFAISAVLSMRFAELAAPFFETVEIVELHHDQKVDAPSGFSLATAERIAAASSTWADDSTQHVLAPGARGAEGPGGVRIHSVRMRGMTSHQEIIFGALSQTLTIRQDSYGRDGYMPGVVLACRRVADSPGLTVGLDAILGI